MRQQVVATLGQLDVLQASGQIDALVASWARFARQTAIVQAHQEGKTPAAQTVKIGPPFGLRAIVA